MSMEYDIIDEGLRRIVCPCCATSGVLGLSYVTTDPACPGMDVFRCARNPAHVWIFSDGKKLIITQEDGRVFLTHMGGRGTSEMVIEDEEGVRDTSSDSAFLVMSFSPVNLAMVVRRSPIVPEEADALLEVCQSMQRQGRNVSFPVHGATIPDRLEEISIIIKGVHINAIVQNVRQIYIGANSREVGFLGDGLPFSVFCLALSAHGLEDGRLFSW